jgi:hypothetical protein
MCVSALSCVLIALLVTTGCRRANPSGTTELTLDVSADQVTGPYTHKNLAIFLITAATHDDRDFLTLDEGLTQGLVHVTEQEQERVGELKIDNQSRQPLYLQEGERLQGGKQDRTILASLVIPPKSGPMSVPTFCVEQSRWQVGANGRTFAAANNVALAPKGVRGAAKVENSQSGVWQVVGVQKKTAQVRLSASNTNSSLNETFDSPRVQQDSQEYAKALAVALDESPEAVGVVILVNGEFEEANIYPNPGVFRKLCPRLIQSYAVQAMMLQDQTKRAAPSAAEMARLLKESEAGAGEKNRESRNIDTRNTLDVSALKDNRFRCVTRYEGKLIHWQVLAKTAAPDGSGVADRSRTSRYDLLGTDW